MGWGGGADDTERQHRQWLGWRFDAINDVLEVLSISASYTASLHAAQPLAALTADVLELAVAAAPAATAADLTPESLSLAMVGTAIGSAANPMQPLFQFAPGGGRIGMTAPPTARRRSIASACARRTCRQARPAGTASSLRQPSGWPPCCW